MGRLNASAPHFIRCIKPNYDKLPEDFDEGFIAKQLKYTGMDRFKKVSSFDSMIKLVRKYRTAISCPVILKSFNCY